MKSNKGTQAGNGMQKAALTQTIKLLKYNKQNKQKNNQSKATLKKSKQNYSDLTPDSLLFKMATSKTRNTFSLKSRFDELINELFMKIDFDYSGFITGTKIAYYKQMPQTLYYFLGGVFQKVRQLGTVTYKIFVNLCNQEFKQAKAHDIQKIFTQNSFATKQRGKQEGSRSKFRISLNKNKCKTDISEKQYYRQNPLQFSTKKIEKSRDSLKKYSLKLKRKPFEHFFQQKKQHSFNSMNKNLNLSLSKSFHHENQHLSFQTQKINQLTERLNRQIQQSSQRIYKNRLVS